MCISVIWLAFQKHEIRVEISGSPKQALLLSMSSRLQPQYWPIRLVITCALQNQLRLHKGRKEELVRDQPDQVIARGVVLPSMHSILNG